MSASVNLSTETALARVRVAAPGGSDAPVPEEFERLKERLVEAIEKGGFTASVRPLTSVGGVNALMKKREDKLARWKTHYCGPCLRCARLRSQRMSGARRDASLCPADARARRPQARLQESGRRVVVAWLLMGVSLVGHIAHSIPVRAHTRPRRASAPRASPGPRRPPLAAARRPTRR